jgi:hypothetical protein
MTTSTGTIAPGVIRPAYRPFTYTDALRCSWTPDPERALTFATGAEAAAAAAGQATFYPPMRARW